MEHTSEPAGGRPWQLSFWALIVTQFQGAFSENAHKYLITFLIFTLADAGSLTVSQRDLYALLVSIFFSVPFILFSMTGGFLADRFSKARVTTATKLFEIVVAITALAGLAFQSLAVQLAAVFLFSTQGALFSASKYGQLPEILPEKRLSWGNGILELTTFLAIIAGSQTGIFASAMAVLHGRQYISGFGLLALTGIGLLSSLAIRRVPAADPNRRPQVNFVSDALEQGRWIRRNPILWMAILGNTFFWFLGALLQFNLLFLGKDVLHISEAQTALLFAAMSFGIAIGSVLTGYLSGGKIEYGFIPLGGIGMTVFGAWLSVTHLALRDIAVLFGLLGFFSGFAAVPLNALIQHRPAEDQKGQALGFAGLLSWIGIILGPAVVYVLKGAGMSPARIFLAGAVLTGLATIYAIKLLPDALIRLVLWLLTHSVYRIRIVGRDNIPEKGGALFVCNHMSFVDPPLLMASTDRFIRFLMFKDIYEIPLIKPFARIMRAIPVSPGMRPRDLIHSLREASQAIRDGEVVCIFAEGEITRIGQMLPFRRGMQRIMKGLDAPIIPVHLDNIWGSIFSFEKGRFLWKLPRQLPYPVTVTFGAPLPATSTPQEVRQAVSELGSEAFALRKPGMRTLGRRFIHTARAHPLRFAMADGRTRRVRFGAALARTVFLARRLRAVWRGQKMVGILLPASVPGALVNLAALVMGKVPVNLNFTASNETVASCARQCGLETVITSREFLERVPVTVPVKTVFLDELAAGPRTVERLAALAVAWLLPAAWLERVCGRTEKVSLDDNATIIFSSGSTGDPKGVILTHYNIASNVQQVAQVFHLESADKILGILPFFHSFGFMATLCLPAAIGMGVVYHANPLDARTVGALVEKYRVTFLLATPTFLQAYIRRCTPENFGSLQVVMAGAEKMPERIAQKFEDTFGLRPLEGYGATECSPAVAVNTRDFRAAGFRQVGAKRGTIGHPLPGISVRIVNADTGEVLPPGEPGLLLVRGPNVMKGYLGRPEKSAEVLKDGWYNTGDIASRDQDGFLAIRDRLSRFSKIGGEMVPHLKIEETLQELAEAAEQVFAVTAVPDERKGERLVVLHTLPPERLDTVLEKFAASDLPPLWRPRLNQFFRVDKLPYLGSGKLDLRALREIALRLSSATHATN